MDISPLGIFKNTIGQVPLIIKTAFLALIGASPNADVQDAITEIITVAARPVFSTPAPLLTSQRQFNKDWGIWGRMWVSKVVVPANEDDERTDPAATCPGPRDALVQAIEALGDGNNNIYDLPKVADVEAEWTGYRRNAWHLAMRPSIMEREQYDKMMDEVEPGAATILYIHGGAFCLMDPCSHRWTTSALAKETHGRCLSIRYRLSPQATFPAALLDAFMSYLYLLQPPPGSFHAAVPASEIVLAADSSGAGLAAGLLLLLNTLPRIGITHVRYQGENIPIRTPAVAGLAVTSPWLDVARSLPSVYLNKRFDTIAAPTPEAMTPNFPPDSVWPADPPRVETYCEASMVSHPLVSPLTARSDLWKGSPPVHVCVGWEGMQDEAEVFARRISQAGSKVVFEGFMGMPHCFAMIPWCWSGWRAFKGWAGFCRDVVKEGYRDTPGHAVWIDKRGSLINVDFDALGLRERGSGEGGRVKLDDETVDRLVREAKAWRVKEESGLRGLDS